MDLKRGTRELTQIECFSFACLTVERIVTVLKKAVVCMDDNCFLQFTL